MKYVDKVCEIEEDKWYSLPPENMVNVIRISISDEILVRILEVGFLKRKRDENVLLEKRFLWRFVAVKSLQRTKGTCFGVSIRSTHMANDPHHILPVPNSNSDLREVKTFPLLFTTVSLSLSRIKTPRIELPPFRSV